jgi:sirohydrochlorin ferrochelatase
MTQILLIDNGSSRPDSTLNLRRLANALSEKSGKTIHPVSLQHAEKADIGALNGIPANTLHPFLAKQLADGEQHFILLPLFYGESRALSSFIPDVKQSLEHTYGSFNLQIADVLYPMPQGEPLLAELLYQNIQLTIQKHRIKPNKVILVDHGSPIAEVAQVRTQLATEVNALLDDDIELIDACMERRKGKSYDFNGKLLANTLDLLAKNTPKQTFIVSLLFTSPGTHAGKGGDIERICEAAEEKHQGLNVLTTPLVGDHSLLIDILHKRLLALS